MSFKKTLSLYTSVPGSAGTLASFYPTNGMQESLCDDGSYISVSCYHTKLYTTTESITVHLEKGLQVGQLKKITFCYKGDNKTATINLTSNWLGTVSHVMFYNEGDQLSLIWTGGVWSVLESLNIVNLQSQTPVIYNY